jgi:ferredoxin
MAKTIKKEKVADLLKALKDFDIYAPVRERDAVKFKKLDVGELPDLDFGNSDKPPKDVFFPQTEKMFDFKLDNKKFVGYEEVEKDDAQMLLFGSRPCDARSFAILDKLFSWDYIDEYWVDKRNRATVISLGCSTPLRNCFCGSIGGDPNSSEGSDMLWTDIGDSYYVDSVTDKGNKILELGGALFADAGSEHQSAAEQTKAKAKAALPKAMNTEGLSDALEKSFEDDYWKALAQRCLGCGICTLLCPTCHCFDISDVVSQGEGKRERTWDSCQTPYYTLHASGHNPRPERKHRQRNRLFHKFWYIDNNLEVVGCVGCGRCISNCPVDIDIIEISEDVKKLKGVEGNE